MDKVRQMSRAIRKGGLAAVGANEPWSCEETPPPLFYVGLELFNKGDYFEQHEALEEIWIEDQRPLRRLYQGILKVGVGFYKLRLGNYRGTVNHIRGGIAYLERFEENCLGIEVARLISDAREVLARVEELGPERLGEFDLESLPTVHFTRRG